MRQDQCVRIGVSGSGDAALCWAAASAGERCRHRRQATCPQSSNTPRSPEASPSPSPCHTGDAGNQGRAGQQRAAGRCDVSRHLGAQGHSCGMQSAHRRMHCCACWRAAVSGAQRAAACHWPHLGLGILSLLLVPAGHKCGGRWRSGRACTRTFLVCWASHAVSPGMVACKQQSAGTAAVSPLHAGVQCVLAVGGHNSCQPPAAAAALTGPSPCLKPLPTARRSSWPPL